MDKIPILISTPGTHTHHAQEARDYHFTGPVGQIPSIQVRTERTTVSLVEGTENKNLPPPPSNSRAQSPQPVHQSWIEQLLPQQPNINSQSNGCEESNLLDPYHLAVPERDSPRRPSTPRADLYEGQNEACFGMTFEHTKGLHMRKSKPKPNAYNHEDQKHCMTMEWLERRGSC